MSTHLLPQDQPCRLGQTLGRWCSGAGTLRRGSCARWRPPGTPSCASTLMSWWRGTSMMRPCCGWLAPSSPPATTETPLHPHPESKVNEFNTDLHPDITVMVDWAQKTKQFHLFSLTWSYYYFSLPQLEDPIQLVLKLNLFSDRRTGLSCSQLELHCQV